MSELAQVLRPLIPSDDPSVLVDASTGDDAAVYLLSEERALVVSVDFFSPVVDDGADFGRIAATNALSDLYAMGADPLFALNLFAFPRSRLESGVAEQIISGGAEVAREAGVPILGGHSIDDPEPKFGMVVIGEVHPDRMMTNAGARVGDVLLLTKPLGIGVITTAIKAGAAPPEVESAAVHTMRTLNRDASLAAREIGVHAGTDVTGYGLLGHLREMLRAGGVSAEIEAGAVPILDGARELLSRGHVPGGTRRNLADLGPDLVWAEGVDEATRLLLVDAQTSGGLLLAVPEDRVEALRGALADRSMPAAVIGRVVEGTAGRIEIR